MERCERPADKQGKALAARTPSGPGGAPGTIHPVGGSASAAQSPLRRVSFRLDIRPDALADIETAAEWYEEQQPGLGADFTRTVRHAVNTLPANPLIYRLRHRRRNVRWFLPPRFPYRIRYHLPGD